MPNTFCKRPLYEVTRRLALVATGVEKADLVIKNARLVNVCTAEVQEHMDVAIAEGRIALVGDAGECIGSDTKVIDADGQYIAPGFIDGHMHIESSLVTIGEYSRVVIPHGTTTIFADPHEIGNVHGKDGVKAMIRDAELTPLKAIINVPSCVPAVPGFEDAGASINSEDVSEMLSWDGVMGLGEMMNFPGVISGKESVHAILAETLKADQIITGHFPESGAGADLNAYIAAGARCCHETSKAQDMLEKMRRGMYVQMRYGSAWHDMPVLIHAILDNNIDDRYACLVTDDINPRTLSRDGHIDHVLRRTIEEGLDPVKAIQFVTINTATCFRMENEIGSITPGKCADIVFFDDLRDIRVTRTIIDGDIVAEDGELTVELEKPDFPKAFYNSIHVGKKLTDADFIVKVPEEHTTDSTINTRVIEVTQSHIGTVEKFVNLSVDNGIVHADLDQDIVKFVVFERHHGTGTKGTGFVNGLGLKKGAMAQTFSHDAHNLIVAGVNDSDMTLAANTLIECGGGMCAVLNGKVLANVPLPIAGLMSDLHVEEVAEQTSGLIGAWKEMGCNIHSPFMVMAFVSLACIPEIRLTNRGIVDCRTYKIVPLFE